MLAMLMMVAALVVGSPDDGFATVELRGAPGAELLVDGKPVTLFDNDGVVVLKLSAEPHRLTVRRAGKTLVSREVTFGAGSRISLTLR